MRARKGMTSMLCAIHASLYPTLYCILFKAILVLVSIEGEYILYSYHEHAKYSASSPPLSKALH